MTPLRKEMGNPVITLVSPLPDCNRYFLFQGVAVGPCDLRGAYKSETTVFDSKLETIKQEKGMWHENIVKHTKVFGDMTYSPGHKAWTPSPTADCPLSGYLTVFQYGNTVPTRILFSGGLGYDGYVSHWRDSSNNYYYGFEKPKDGTTNVLWDVWYASCTRSKPNIVYSLGHFQLLELVPGTGDSVVLKYTSRYATMPTYPTKAYMPSNWWDFPPTVRDLRDLYSSIGKGESAASSSSVNRTNYRISPTGVFSINEAMTKIDMRVANLREGDSFPISEMHYGVLAMDAAQKVNANKTNMLEFLRDIRNPKELIPKLATLRGLLSSRKRSLLKDMSDDYLAVKFGVLPTISDLQNIVAAFRRRKPFLDRNGFQVYTARHDDSALVDNISYTLEQHVKLAIDQEDNEFQLLLEKLDSFGTLPTLERLWDLIPYSFLIDWFVDVGGLLERVDTRLRLLMFNIRYVTMSRKETTLVDDQPSVDSPYLTSVSRVHYHRWVTDHCPAPPISADTPFRDFSHWLELSALYIQRAKR